MARYVVGEESKEEEKRVKTKPKRVLEKAMKEAWQKPEMNDIKDRLSEVAKTHWKPQVEEAIRTTKYDEELKSRAREIEYDKKVKKVWE